jgi:hypothetical protein
MNGYISSELFLRRPLANDQITNAIDDFFENENRNTVLKQAVGQLQSSLSSVGYLFL